MRRDRDQGDTDMTSELTTTAELLRRVTPPRSVSRPKVKTRGPRTPRTRAERGMVDLVSLRILRHSVLEKEVLGTEGSKLLDVMDVGIAKPDERTDCHAVVDATYRRHPLHLDLWPQASARLSTGPVAWMETPTRIVYHLPEALHAWVEEILQDRDAWRTHHAHFTLDARGQFRAPVEMILPEYLEGLR